MWRTGVIILGIVFLPFSAQASVVKVQKSSDGWRLLVDGKPFFVKGMAYAPDKVGESAHDGSRRGWSIVDDDRDGRIDVAYQSWVDKNRNNQKDVDEPEVGDFQLLKDMGCNTIRVYHHPTDDAELVNIYHGSQELCHAPNKALYRELFEKYGIRIAMGDLLGAYTVGSGAQWADGTNYLLLAHRRNMLKSVEKMVNDFKDEPYILFWVLGNENDYGQWTKNNSSDIPEVYARFVNEAAELIHKLDPNHPVCLSSGSPNYLRKYGHLIPAVDILAYNDYRNPDFGDLWEVNARAFDKPVILGEFGTGYPPVEVKEGVARMNEERQAQIHQNCWKDILAHAAGGKAPGNAIGGFVFVWLDNWWEDGNPWKQDLMPNGWHHEWNGIVSQGNGEGSPLVRQLRKVYFMYKEMWTGK